jgi:hypothetical protein
MVKHRCAALLAWWLACAPAARAAEPPPKGNGKGPPGGSMAKDPHRVEVTFGSSQLFSHQPFLGTSGTVRSEIVPVSSALIMFEWLFHDRFSAVSLCNIPLGTQKSLKGGEVREEYVAPSLAFGARAAALRFEIFEASRLELHIAALGGVVVGHSDGPPVFPLFASRVHFANKAGFALYLGTAYAFDRDTLALHYGIGHRF